MNRSGKILTGLLIALAGSGVILGPGYLGYCWFFSGSAAGEYPITVGKPLELELSPEMNPIRFNSVVEYLKRQTISTRRTDYRATLKERNRELWTTTFSVTHSSDRDKERHRGTGVGIGLRSTVTSHSSIRMFSVERPGRYLFLVTPGPQSQLHVQSITLKVRKNVTGVNVPLTVAGFVMLGMALFGGLVKVFRGSKTGHRRKRDQ